MRSVFGVLLVAVIVIALNLQRLRSDDVGMRDFMSELTTTVKNGPSKNYKRTRLISVEDFHNQLGKKGRWAYVAGTWDAMRFITYYFDDTRFNWLADCQEGNIGDEGFTPVDIERQLKASLEFGLDPAYPATAATMLSFVASCSTKDQ